MIRTFRFRPSIALVIATALGLAGVARADFAAVTFGPSGPPDNANYYGGQASAVVGYEFTPTTDLQVNALGFYDIVTTLPNVPGSADGLAVPHQVGIYQVSDQSLIASGTVPAGTAGFEVDHFRYTQVASTTLTAGTEYVIAATTGAFVKGVFGQDATVNATLGTNFSVNGITLGDLRQNNTGDGFSLVFPGFASAPSNLSYGFGPNFGFFTPVPEPSSLALMGLGALGVAAFARRRRRAN